MPPSRSFRASRRSSAWISSSTVIRLDDHAPADAADDRVPCSKVAFDAERDFGPPLQSAVDATSEALQESLLAGVANRVTAWIGPDRQVQSDDATTMHRDLRGRRWPAARARSEAVVDGTCPTRLQPLEGSARFRRVQSEAPDRGDGARRRLGVGRDRRAVPASHDPIMHGGHSLAVTRRAKPSRCWSVWRTQATAHKKAASRCRLDVRRWSITGTT